MSTDAHGADPSGQRAAEEAQLAAMTSTDMMLQASVLLLNIGGRRLGLAPPSASPEELAAARADRDLDQVRDAIDAVRGLLGVLERTVADELRPLRDALSQLQMAYAREVQSAGASAGAAAGEQDERLRAAGGAAAAAGKPASAPPEGVEEPASTPPKGDEDQRGPGPAESSGRLWVPGR